MNGFKHLALAVPSEGPAPNRSDRPDPAMHADHMAHFRGNEMRAGGGHEGGRR